MSPKARESVITSVVLLIIYGFLFAQTMGMPSTPALFPRVCLILLTVLTVIMLYLDVRKYAKDHDAESGVHWKEIAVPLVAFAAIVATASVSTRTLPSTIRMIPSGWCGMFSRS